MEKGKKNHRKGKRQKKPKI